MASNNDKGKELELLVERLQNLLAYKDVEIKWNEFVRGKISGSRRQLDVTIRGTGECRTFIVLECRKHKDPQEVEWIEQLASKKLDVGADRIIAVSSSGFTSGAIKIAKKFGVELRVLNKISSTDISNWFWIQEMIFIYVDYKIYHFIPEFSPEIIGELNRTYLNSSEFSYMIVKNGYVQDPEAIFVYSLNHDKEFFEFFIKENKIRVRQISVPQEGYQVLINNKLFPLSNFSFSAQVWTEEIVSPIEYVTKYTSVGNEVIAEIVEASAEIKGQMVTIALEKDMTSTKMVAKISPNVVSRLELGFEIIKS